MNKRLCKKYSIVSKVLYHCKITKCIFDCFYLFWCRMFPRLFQFFYRIRSIIHRQSQISLYLCDICGMYLEAVFRFYVLLNHFVGHFFFGLVRFGSFSNTIYRNLALALSKLHINVDITVGFFVGQKNYRLNGYIHVKAIPGADPELIEKVGYLADRMSINLELPTAESLRRLAPHKNRKNILAPIRQIQNGIRADRLLSGDQLMALPDKERQLLTPNGITATKQRALTVRREQPHFVPAGQSTQMIIGATPESDYQIVSVAEALYKNYDLKRVFYSAYIPINEDKELPALGQKPPLLREHRLYQADWLLRFYGFQSTELLSEEKPNFNVFLDPKCDWAVRHLECFPVEINKADYYTLLRVPGIGVKSAQRIMKARRYAVLDFDDIKRLGVVLKRAVYFITCQGRMMYRIRLEENFITHNLIDNDKKKTWSIENDMTYRQLSLFDDFQMDSWEVVG